MVVSGVTLSEARTKPGEGMAKVRDWFIFPEKKLPSISLQPFEHNYRSQTRFDTFGSIADTRDSCWIDYRIL